MIRRKLTSEQVARATLGEPVQQGRELAYRCVHPEQHQHGDAHPSLKINPHKDMWGCFVCRASGKGGWSLAAFLAGYDPSDKASVRGWLVAQGLLSKRQRKATAKVISVYAYLNEDKIPIARKLRFEPKGFAWQHLEDGQWVSGLGGVEPGLYHWPEIPSAADVLVVEGEKDVETAEKLGFTATCNPGGAGEWRSEYSEALRGKDVAIIADADDAGLRHARTIALSLYGKADSVKLIERLPVGKDLTEWLELGGSEGREGARKQLLDLIAKTPEWRPPDGAVLVREFEDLFSRYIVAPRGVALITALYAFMTHCFEIFSWIPYLSFCSPLESCGKSHAADIVGWASARPEILVDVTEASLYRLITDEKPTVVVDEAEILSGNSETAIALRAVLHAGCAPDTEIIRCAPNTHELERFSPWCPKIFCAIGKLQPALASRCIAIEMKRKTRDERTKGFVRARVKADATGLGARIGVWVAAHESEILQAYTSLLEECDGRRDENFAPLRAVLQVADPTRMAEFGGIASALIQASERSLADETKRQLLQDIRDTFAAKDVEEIHSAELVGALNEIETSPWGEWYHGKPLSTKGLARLLKPFGIYPGKVQNGNGRGYRQDQFKEAFDRYLPFASVQVSNLSEYKGLSGILQVSGKCPPDTLKN